MVDTSNYNINRPLLITNENKKVLGKFKDELGGKIMTKVVGLCSKTYAYLIDDFEEIKKNKGVKMCVVKTELQFNYYKDSLFNNNVILKSQQRFKSEIHNAYTEEVNKMDFSSIDDKRAWATNKITSYPYGYKGKHVKEIS